VTSRDRREEPHEGREQAAHRDEAQMQATERRSVRQRMTWSEILSSADLRGRWIALGECSFDEQTGQATEGLVVDADDDLGELCSRMRDSRWRNCAICFAEGEARPQRLN